MLCALSGIDRATRQEKRRVLVLIEQSARLPEKERTVHVIVLTERTVLCQKRNTAAKDIQKAFRGHVGYRPAHS